MWYVKYDFAEKVQRKMPKYVQNIYVAYALKNKGLFHLAGLEIYILLHRTGK